MEVITAFIFIPSFINICSCSVTMLSQKFSSFSKSYVNFSMVKPVCLKYNKLSANKESSSVLKNISPFFCKNCL